MINESKFYTFIRSSAFILGGVCFSKKRYVHALLFAPHRPRTYIDICRLFVFTRRFIKKTFTRALLGADLSQPLLRISKVCRGLNTTTHHHHRPSLPPSSTTHHHYRPSTPPPSTTHRPPSSTTTIHRPRPPPTTTVHHSRLPPPTITVRTPPPVYFRSLHTLKNILLFADYRGLIHLFFYRCSLQTFYLLKNKQHLTETDLLMRKGCQRAPNSRGVQNRISENSNIQVSDNRKFRIPNFTIRIRIRNFGYPIG
ncbi:hypothetical protein HanIR_Chr09g0441031 [Helianthus annuus]|nr:hypothetical protein HanIR_Chr09g0441031 [Helianthus annuus]